MTALGDADLKERFRLGWKTAALGGALVLAGGAATASIMLRPEPLTPAPALASLDASAEKGAYLARIGNCAACHTAKGQAPYAGGVRFETPFGIVHSTNITPDRQHGIGGWDFAGFRAAMKHGVRPDGANLYPVFPYTSFAKLTDEDMASLYLFLKSVAPAAVPNRANAMDFPFGNRALLTGWKRLFHEDASFAAQPGKSEIWNRGAYLVEALAHCGACHTPRNPLGGLKEGHALEGGTYVDQVASGAYRKWAAVDLTPGAQGLASWTRDDISAYLLTGKNARTVVHGPMNEVIESTRHLAPADANAIAAYLKGIPASGTRRSWSLGALLEGRRAAGEVVYTVHCGTCHLPDGKGDRILGASLVKNPIVQAPDAASLINVILYGPHLPPPPFSSGRTRMPAFGKRLSDEDIAALATYLRDAFGNKAGAVTAEEVYAQR